MTNYRDPEPIANIAFHVGYHKTATTWLQQSYFPSHPAMRSLVDSRQPGADPFLRYLIGKSDRCFQPERCSELLTDALMRRGKNSRGAVNLVSAERLSGHPFSGGYDSVRIAERIRKVVPSARILIVIRNQISMITSVYKQLLAEGYAGSLERLIRTECWKAAGFRMDFYEYDRLLEKYRELFSPEQVFMTTYEQMRSDRSGFLHEVCDFLRVPFSPPSNGDRIVHPSLPNWFSPVVQRLNHFRRSELNPTPTFNLGRRFVPLAIHLAHLIPGRRGTLHRTSDEMIMRYYRKPNERLRHLLGAKLPNYP